LISLIDDVCALPELRDFPPVLLDIGASGKIHPKWKKIARHAVCLAFDPDSREMGYAVREADGFKKLIIFGKAATAGDYENVDFFLTRSPFCSSTLRPNAAALSDWHFAPFFEVEQETELPAINLAKALSDCGITKVDWFKTDSQGTDLRLFASLGPAIIERVLVAEFEPGILDAYLGEDKMWQVLSFMEGRPFWLSELNPQLAKRVRGESLGNISPLLRRLAQAALAGSPGWCEMTYLNTFRNRETLSKRDYLLGWIFAALEKQHGFALELANDGAQRFPAPVFDRLRQASRRGIACGCWRIPLILLRLMAAKIAALSGGS
jgi:hypothetical protein